MDAVLDLLAQLVAIDTTSRESNLGLISLVEDRLGSGWVTRRTSDDTGTKANLLARLGPEVEGGIVLSAHTDCVPVEGQPWSGDPFELRRDGQRVFGRGATDMKGFIACVLDRVAALEGDRLQRPLYLALSYDEEIGTVGVPRLIDDLLANEPRPRAVLVGEPTDMAIVDAHKGVRAYRTTVTGKDAHSSQPQKAANAIIAAARIVGHIAEVAAERAAAAADPTFEPPHTTFNVGQISGGQAINIVARTCEIVWEYRPVPADDDDALRERIEAFARDEVLPHLRRTAPDADITTESISVVPTLRPEDGGAAEALARRLLDDAGPTRSVAYGTDGGPFQRAGLSTVVVGPGSIDQAHQPDEWIAIDQLEACTRFVDRLVADLSG